MLLSVSHPRRLQQIEAAQAHPPVPSFHSCSQHEYHCIQEQEVFQKLHHISWHHWNFINIIFLNGTYNIVCSSLVSTISENSGVLGDGSSFTGEAPNSNFICVLASSSSTACLFSTYLKKLDRMMAVVSLQVWLVSSSSSSPWQVWLVTC